MSKGRVPQEEPLDPASYPQGGEAEVEDGTNYQAEVEAALAQPDERKRKEMIHKVRIDLCNAINMHELTYEEWRRLFDLAARGLPPSTPASGAS